MGILEEIFGTERKEENIDKEEWEEIFKKWAQ